MQRDQKLSIGSVDSAGSFNNERHDDERSMQYLLDPQANYESFQRYISHLNHLIRKNLPFLTAMFGITSLTMSPVLTNNIFLTKGLKKKLFKTDLAQTQVLV